MSPPPVSIPAPLPVTTPPAGAGVPVRFAAADGLPLGGYLWRHQGPAPQGAVVVIACATSVRARYYARFAGWLHDHGFNVLSFDYRGIGESRPARLRGFAADWTDWGEKDVEGALRFAQACCPGDAVDVVAHSFGGVALGLAPSNAVIRRAVTVGAQYAHWRDYAPAARAAMRLKWHVTMPALTALFGHFPGRRLGWMEDTPKGVALDWAGMGPHYPSSVRRHAPGTADTLAARFAQVSAPILAIGLDDDPFGTVPALERTLAHFTGAARTHLRIAPGDAGVDAIGHFAFFHERFRAALWRLPLEWLTTGARGPQAPGRMASHHHPGPAA
ncbi:alpha/beta hydrolase family protein [Ancylobacter radicis]|uniref:alpha/beta hydrolase family protein n=1 Tax=Ancylobacter radicis TaxID=2836179 RepID=UPI00350FF8F0